eukprot:s2856_g4.t1
MYVFRSLRTPLWNLRVCSFRRVRKSNNIYARSGQGVYSARCDDGFWWASAACRSDLSKCVGHVTAGVGYGAEEAMQKFTVHNMPVAIGVAESWSTYKQLPLGANVTFYWWAPDPIFLDLSPIFLEFPTYNAREHAAGYYPTAASEVPINTAVSSDLVVLAPFVQTFADKLDLPMEQMNAMLLDHKNTGDTWRDVTCRWITANRAVWQKWIPDESECFPGFGLYDSVVQDFTDSRVNATNKIVCQAGCVEVRLCFDNMTSNVDR